MEIFQYAFMQRAFLAGLLLAVIIPCIGITVILKRLSMMGDALAHTSLAGVAAGLLLQINPVLGAMAAAVAGALSIEVIRKKIPRYAELSIAIVMSAGIGLAGVLSGFLENTANFDSFLFGSIVSVNNFELKVIAIVSTVVFLAFLILYRALFFISLDEQGAKLAGVPVAAVNFLFTILTAITISVAGRAVGALIVSSMMVIPVTCAMQFGKSYRHTIILSILFAMLFMTAGLVIAYYADLKPGGTVVLSGVATLIIILFGKYLGNKANHRR